MKKVIAIFLCVMFLTLTITNYVIYQKSCFEQLLQSDKNYKYKLSIPNDTINNDFENLVFLKQAANEHGINIFREPNGYGHNETLYYDVYVYLSTTTTLFDNIKLKNGRYLTKSDMKYSSSVLSTERNKNKAQVGVIDNFGSRYHYSMYPIDALRNVYEYSGEYYIESSSQKAYKDFIDSYVLAINNYYNLSANESVNANMYVTDDIRTFSQINYELTLFWISGIFLVFILMIIIFYLIKNSKNISVMKLMGYSDSAVCRTILVKFLCLNSLVLNAIIISIATVVSENSSVFITKVFLSNLIAFLILLTISLIISLLYTKQISINHCIKGKKPIHFVLIFNGIMKITISVIVILLLVRWINDLVATRQRLEALNHWASASNYGTFPHIIDKNASLATEPGRKEFNLDANNAYPFLNSEMGGLLANSYEYTQTFMVINSHLKKPQQINVNPNYLNEFPVYNEKGEKIVIREDEKRCIFLIPEQYKNAEEDYRKYFLDWRNEWLEFHESHGENVESRSNEIEIIYIKAKQKIPSFNLDVYPKNFNLIVDPIIFVVTEANSTVYDRMFYNVKPHIFIPLINGDVKKTYSKLNKGLKNYNIADNFSVFVRLDNEVTEQIMFLKQTTNDEQIVIIFLSLLLILPIFQSVYLLIEHNRNKNFLRKTFGYSFFERHQKIYLFFICILPFEMIVCVAFIGFDPWLTLILLGKLALELVLVSYLISFFDKKDTINILRSGGN